MRQSLRRKAFKWLERRTRTVKEVTPILAYEAGYRACLADRTGEQFKPITPVPITAEEARERGFL
jgi:hypothetical protein